jgi:preprotein translocase subunit SecA
MNHYAGIRDRIRTRCFQPTRRDEEFLCAVNQRADSLRTESDQHLKRLTRKLRDKAAEDVAVTDPAILIPALALAKQALERSVQMSAFNVQILAGIAMCHGAIVEMQTGEGKTLSSTFPIVAHALTGQGVHVATVNAYLAERDFEFMRPVLQLLGVTIGIARDGGSTTQKRLAYECDVTYATGYELGFDFLRDQITLMSRGPDRLGTKLRRQLLGRIEETPDECQRGRALAIIDEVDSVLIDEAMTPLVLSSGSRSSTVDGSIYHQAAQTAAELEFGADFFIDEKTRALFLTENGSRKAHARLESARQTSLADANRSLRPDGGFSSAASQSSVRVQGLAELAPPPSLGETMRFPVLARPWKNYVESALRAHHLMMRDVHYVVRDGKVEIVDESTGRIFSDRNWRDGLHQAVEAKEGVPITDEKRTLARISRQRYFQRYETVCGMTGTASGHEQELFACYGTPVVMIPLRKRSRRKELPTRYFSSESAKIAAVTRDVMARHGRGQPVLIGTRTIEQSLRLSQRLKDEQVQHQVLNGIQDASEANLVSNAGCAGCITVATNMAGARDRYQTGSVGSEGWWIARHWIRKKSFKPD